MKVFDPNSLDPERCESCYGAETEDIKWADPGGGEVGGQGYRQALYVSHPQPHREAGVGVGPRIWRGWGMCLSHRVWGTEAPCPALPGAADLEKRLKWPLLWLRGAIWSPAAWFRPHVLGPGHIASLVNDDYGTFLVRVTSGLSICVLCIQPWGGRPSSDY